MSFKSQVKRFNKAETITPGVGAYSLNRNEVLSDKQFFNKKGFGNIFQSKSDRFDQGYHNNGYFIILNNKIGSYQYMSWAEQPIYMIINTNLYYIVQGLVSTTT